MSAPLILSPYTVLAVLPRGSVVTINGVSVQLVRATGVAVHLSDLSAIPATDVQPFDRREVPA